jgi:hypothetical protein
MLNLEIVYDTLNRILGVVPSGWDPGTAVSSRGPLEIKILFIMTQLSQSSIPSVHMDDISFFSVRLVSEQNLLSLPPSSAFASDGPPSPSPSPSPSLQPQETLVSRTIAACLERHSLRHHSGCHHGTHRHSFNWDSLLQLRSILSIANSMHPRLC